MRLLDHEQINAARQSIQNGAWGQSARIVTARLRSYLYRVRKAWKPATPNLAIAPETEPSVDALDARILPLFVRQATNLELVTGLEGLFRDVHRQIWGEFRLAGGRYNGVRFGGGYRFPEIEDQHALERLYWAVRYTRASAFGQNEALAAFWSNWAHWLRGPHDEISLAPYTVAERIASLSECLFWLQYSDSAAQDGDIIAIKRQIFKDARLLFANVEYRLGVHNHLLNDARGLYRASRVLSDLGEANQWGDLAFQLWETYFPQLTLADGTFGEQSSHYHLLLCRTALEYFLAAKDSRREIPAAFREQMSRMFALANEIVRSDGTLPRFGDSSPDQTAEDLSGLITAAYHHGLLTFRPRDTAVTPLTLFYCGEAPSFMSAAPISTQCFYPDGGFMFLRSQDESIAIAMHGDPRPAIRAHGDSGRGTFELWWHGSALIREPGSILSTSDPRSRWSRSALAQNVTRLNGLGPEPAPESRPFLPADYAQHGGEWSFGGEREVTFRWNGFERIRKNIVVSRTWQLDGSDQFIMEERIEGTGDVRFESRMLLGDDRWSRAGNGPHAPFELEWTGPNGVSASIHLAVPQQIKATVTQGVFLPEFGVEQTASMLRLTGNITLPASWKMTVNFRNPKHYSFAELRQQCVA